MMQLKRNGIITFSDGKDVLLAVARCEARIADQNRLLEKIMTLKKSILRQVQQMKPGTSNQTVRLRTT